MKQQTITPLLVLFLIICGCVFGAAASKAADESADSKSESELLFEDRKALSLDAFAGKVVVLELGGVGCPMTHTYYQALQELRGEYPNGVQFLRVDYKQSVAATKEYYRKNVPAIHIIGDPTGRIGESFPSQAYPTLYLVGKWGEIRYMGGYEPAAFRSMLNRLLFEDKANEKNFFLAKKLDKGDLLPGFTLPDLSNRKTTLKKYRGKSKAFVLVFAGTGCPISSTAVESLGELVRKRKDGDLKILVVNVGEKASRVREVYGPMDLPFSVLIDSEGKLVETFGIESVPTVFVAGEHGDIVLRSLWHFDSVKQEIAILTGKMRPEDRKTYKQKGTG